MRRMMIVGLLIVLWVGFGRMPTTHADGSAPATPTGDEPNPDTTERAPQDEARYGLNMSEATFNASNATYLSQGRQLVDIDIRWDGSAERYNAIWHPVDGDVYSLIQGTPSDWSDFIADMAPKNGRYLDVDVAYFGGDKRYSALFIEDGDDYAYALRTTNDDATFQGYLEQYLNDGLSIIDFEAYTEPDGDVRFAGVWVGDPNQPKTVLYYGLETADVSDLIAPRHGRVIDIEYYFSELHNENRWAMIFAMDSGGEQFQRRNDTSSGIISSDASFTDSNTELIDIESYTIGGVVRYSALWGDTYKSLHTVDAIPGDSDAETISPITDALAISFEAGGAGTIGLYAKNVRSNQSWGFRPNEPFYLASTAKIPVHIKLWREIENGHLTATQTIPYTNGSNRRDSWYVDERSFPGFSSANFGSSFSLQRFDQAMMQVSDNGATSALVDSPTIGLMQDSYNLNEWLADVSGVGQGWGPVTSIHDVDRAIIWQGQQTVAHEPECSYFLTPGWALEPWWRNGDTWGDLDSWLDANASGCERNNIPDGQSGWSTSLARTDSTTGHYRYYNMGLNTATPRATALLLEKLVQGELLNAATTTTAITTMTPATALNDYGSNWPSYIDVYAKGGSKGGDSNPISDAGIIDLGPDAIVLSVFTENNSRTGGTIRNSFTSPIAIQVLAGLAADLDSCYSSRFDGADTLYAGQTLRFFCFIRNEGGGDASNFEVDFYASTNTTISSFDTFLGTVAVSGLDGGVAKQLTLDVPLPAGMLTGDYYIGWIIDPVESCFSADSDDCRNQAKTRSFGNVGEWDEDNNEGYDTNEMLTVVGVPTAVGLDSAETGSDSRAVAVMLIFFTAVLITLRWTRHLS